MIICPFRTFEDSFKACDERECALWLGNECSFKALGRAAQCFISDKEFAEIVALHLPAKKQQPNTRPAPRRAKYRAD